jgi:hypothetical protein
VSMEVDNLKAALDTLLVANEGTSFVTVGVKNRSNNAEVLKKRPQVTTYIDSGDFPKGQGSSITGPYSHSVTIKIDLLATAAAKVDLAVLKSDTASTDAIAAALAASTTATAQADALWDKTRALVWDIIMRPANKKLGLGYNPGRWITHIDKYTPATKGSLAIVSGTLTMTATVLEYPTSATPVEGKAIDGIVETTADISGADLDSARAGAKVGT